MDHGHVDDHTRLGGKVERPQRLVEPVVTRSHVGNHDGIALAT